MGNECESHFIYCKENGTERYMKCMKINEMWKKIKVVRDAELNAEKYGERDANLAEKEDTVIVKILPTIVFLGAMFFLGRSIAAAVDTVQAGRMWESDQTVQMSEVGDAAASVSNVLSSENWGLGFGAEGAQPTGNASASALAEYNAYYVGGFDEKVIETARNDGNVVLCGLEEIVGMNLLN